MVNKNFLCQDFKSLFKNQKNQRGSVMVIVSAAMAALLGMAALVSDFGLLVLNKTRLSAAVDAAALAGARELPYSALAAQQKAEEYVQLNDAGIDKLSITISENNSKIQVDAEKTVNLILFPALGINTGKVRASAAAVTGAFTSVRGAVPLGVPEQKFQFGQEYELKQGSHGSRLLGPGNFGALKLGDDNEDGDNNGGGAKLYREYLKYGYSGELKIGDTVGVKSGNMSGPTRQAIEYRLDRCSGACTPGNIEPGCPRVLIVVVYDPSTIDPNQKVKEVTISGFAAFLVTEVPGSGNENIIRGYFLDIVETSASDFTIDPGESSTGLRGIKLVS